MATDIKIDFNLAGKFNYAGLDNDQIPPEYPPFSFKIDYVALLDFLAQSGVVDYNYTQFESDRKGLYGSIWLDLMTDGKPLSNPAIGVVNNEEKYLGLNAKLNKKVGKIDLNRNYGFGFEIKPDDSLEKYSLKIPYADISNPSKDDDYAVIITSQDFYEMNYLIELLHHDFSKLETWLFDRFDAAFDKYNHKDQLDFLYQEAPTWVVSKRANDKVFNDLKKILSGSVNSYGTNEEKAVLNIIRSFATFPYYHNYTEEANIDIGENASYLLEKSITEKIGSDTVFERIYSVMHDWGGEDNFSIFIQLFYLFWLESKYPKLDYGPYKDGGALILDYKSNKILGFYSDGKKFSFNGNHIKITEKVQGGYEDSGMGTVIISEHDELVANPHLYQPINIPEIEQDGEMKFLSNIVPAFYLKAFDDKNAYRNLEKASWLVVDIVTTFTGVGNLLKLRHLVTVYKGLKVLRIAIAGIEIASGVLGVMLNFVEECDTPDDKSFCSKLRTFLLYVDLATLGVDALASKFIRKAAKNALDNMPPALRRKHEDIADELRAISLTQEAKRGFKRIGAGSYEILPQNLLKKYITDAQALARKKGINLEIKWIDKGHPDFLSDKLGVLKVSTRNKKIAQLHLRPDCPKITWFHENKHLEDLLSMGWKKYTRISRKTPWIHEKSVWLYLLKNRNKWSEFELVDAYLYYKKYLKKKTGGDLTYVLKEFEELSKKYI